MKIVSWNVNGIVACRRKGFLKFLSDVKPDIVCCQEIKTQCPLNTPGYLQFWNPAERKGYSGTLILARREPLSHCCGMGIKKFDCEGRMITLEYKDFYVINVYAPSLNPHSAPERPDYRIAWDKALRKYVTTLQKPAILCGDFNVTRAFIDSYPENGKNLPDEPIFRSEIRDGFERLLSAGLVDVFRALYPVKEGAYTWWGPKNKNRAFNRGSRLDYFLISGELLPFVQSIKFHSDTLGSDHCPISMLIYPMTPKAEMNDEDLAVLWRTIDWPKMKDELMRMQQELAQAAFEREWEQVEYLRRRITDSWAAKVLAVQAVADINSEMGVDGVRWSTDTQKARAARSLISRGYHPIPCRYIEITEDNGKVRPIHVPAYRDKAMAVLQKYALDPIAESTADRKSFSARKGRSTLDAHAYLVSEMSGPDAPEWIVIIDIKSYYESAVHDWLVANIPMDKAILRKLLKAGVIKNGDLFSTEQGISLGNPLSPVLGNMMLDGLQSYIYDHLYPDGGVDYLDGNVTRFADDIAVTTRSRERAELILRTVSEFLAERGLRVNPQKTHIRRAIDGFEFLGRFYQKRGTILYAKPSEGSIRRTERKLTNLISNYKGTLQTLIGKVNAILRGFGGYHRVEDAYMEFRHIDAVVEGLLVNRMCRRHPRWHRETILKKFWIDDGGNYIFALPSDPTVRVMLLAPTPIVRHKPCRLKFNPYLDVDYYGWLKYKREVQKADGKYRAVWMRQGGKCAYCGRPMLPDQEIEVVEKELGEGRHPRNLLYIHRQCAYQVISDTGEAPGERLDLFALLDGIMDDAPMEESPYLELREFFRLCDKTPLSLTFQEIEHILGNELDWEAYFYQAFWYDDMPGMTSPMWREEGFPFHIFLPSTPDYCIAGSWLSQGYKIKSLRLDKQKVVFRRVVNYQAGLAVPKALLERKLPDAAVHESKKFFEHLIKKYGL